MGDLQKIGAYCAKARRRKGLKQYQIAQRTNYSVSTISMFERGQVNNVGLFWWYIENLLTTEDKIEMGIVNRTTYQGGNAHDA